MEWMKLLCRRQLMRLSGPHGQGLIDYAFSLLFVALVKSLGETVRCNM